MPTLVPDPSASESYSVAAARQSDLQAHLTEFRDREGIVPFRELPENVDAERPRFVEGPAAVAEVARLNWQLQSPGLLLLERVTDLVELALVRHIKELAPGSVTVSLRPLPYRPVRTGKPPWRVVISAPTSNGFDDTIRRSSDFLGIGVYRRRQSRFRWFSRCQIGDGGLDGVVGGVVRSQGSRDPFLVTCAHVITAGCGSLSQPQGPLPDNAPDAVLLRKTGCFEHPDSQSLRVFSAGIGDTTRLQLSKTPLMLNSQHTFQRRRGWLKYPVSAVLGLKGELVRFPHYSVQPFRYRIGFLRWPIFGRHFAAPGDSGTWVVERDTNLWLGMVIGGYDHDLDTLVVDGKALLEYFSGLISPGTPQNLELVTHTWP